MAAPVRSLFRRIVLLAALAALAALSTSASAGLAGATTAMPTIGSFTASTTDVAHVGGAVTFQAQISGASNDTKCALTVDPNFLGRERLVDCSDGRYATTVDVPADSGASRVLSFTLEVSMTDLASYERTRIVDLTQDGPPATLSGLRASPASLPLAGGTVTLSAYVGWVDQCTWSVTPALAALPATQSWASAPAARRVVRVVRIPRNTTGAPVDYAFTLEATAPGDAAGASGTVELTQHA